MVRKTLVATATAAALLAGGVLTAAPAMAERRNAGIDMDAPSATELQYGGGDSSFGGLTPGVWFPYPIWDPKNNEPCDNSFVSSACGNYAEWNGDLTVIGMTSGFEWTLGVRYSFAGQNITDAPCPGGWGPNQNTGSGQQQLCRFSLSTDDSQLVLNRSVTVTIEGGSKVTDPKTGNSTTLEEISIPMTSDMAVSLDGSPLWFRLPAPPTTIGPIGASLEDTQMSFIGEGITHGYYTLYIALHRDEIAKRLGEQVSRVNLSDVGSAADVETENSLGAAPDGDAFDDAPSDDGAQLGARSKTLTTGDHQVVKEHHTRVEKMAAKVHNQGGVLTIHAYGPDEGLALARALAVRKHLEAQLAKRGHIGSSPIWVTYAGDPDHKKGVQATVHHHPGTTLPGALPGVK